MAPTPDVSGRLDEVMRGGSALGAGNILVLLLVLAVICFAAYYVTRLISGKALRMMRSRKMHIVDRLALSRDKQLLIVQVGDEAHLIAVSNAAVSELALLPSEILREPSPETPQGDSFLSRFAGAMKENITAKVNARRAPRRPRSAYERAKTEYERSLKEQGPFESAEAQRDSERPLGNVDDVSELAQRRSMRYRERGDGE